MTTRTPRAIALLATASLLIALAPPGPRAASHREAPITAKDRLADITDWFAFRSYEEGREDTITMILAVDPLLEPSNGPNFFPFDPAISYRMYLDNDRDGMADRIWEFAFESELRGPTGLFTAAIGAGEGIPAPENAPAPEPALGVDSPASGETVVPPAITSLWGDGSAWLAHRQTFTVTVYDGSGAVAGGPWVEGGNAAGGHTLLTALPTNVGPRTMPDYETELAPEAIFTLPDGVRVFAGTVDDPFYIDLGGAFDTFNLPVAVLDGDKDDDGQIVGDARDDVSGFNVNVIAIEVPISSVTATGEIPAPDTTEAVIGTWGATFRDNLITELLGAGGAVGSPGVLPGVQVQRMGNPLINELVIGNRYKDSFSTSAPATDGRFADQSSAGTAGDPPDFFLNPFAARALNAAFGLPVPDPPRTDLIPLVRYAPPICPACPDGGTGPVADMLRLNVGVPPAEAGAASRLGALAGDLAGHPNGRRVFDDVTDIFLRVTAGVLTGMEPFTSTPNTILGDGVNRNDREYQDRFPYVAFAHSGRDSRHVDRGEPLVLDDDDGMGGRGNRGNGDSGETAGVLFSVGRTAGVTHAGGHISLRPGKVYRYEPSSNLIEIVVDPNALGINLGRVDAVADLGGGAVAFSVEDTRGVSHAGGYTVLRPQNVYSLDPATGVIELLFDGRAVGLRDLVGVDFDNGTAR